MKRARALTQFGLAVVTLGLFATPVAAQSVNRNVIDELNTQLLYVALPLTLFVELTLVHAIYRFRNNDDPSPTVDDRALELTWNTATAVILVFVGLSAYFVLSNPYLTPAGHAAADSPQPDMEVQVTAYQWGWQFHYPDANVTTHTDVVIPRGKNVKFTLHSDDVIHSLYIPKLGVKQDIFPGSKRVALTKATKTGEYRLYCAEFCGAGHSRMHGTVTVLNQSAYRDWLDNQTSAS